MNQVSPKTNAMKPLAGLIFLLLTSLDGLSQSPAFLKTLEAGYETFSEQSIQTRRFKHSDVEPLILSLNAKDGFEVKKAGESVEGRGIFLVKVGAGPVKVLLWSQMHGDETTATRVLLDLFNFLADKTMLTDEKQKLLSQVTLYCIPMLNPDGAQQFERRNAFGIDINRDALRLQSPEAKILKNVRDSISPDFGFNLHDQNTATSAGDTGYPATLSFLAPAYNEEKEINDVRERAMQVIVALNHTVQQYMPGQVGRYDDTFEPRAFGDNIQKWGTSTILIECGGYSGDPEKQFIRKIHLLALTSALMSIGDGSYKSIDRNQYFDIPENGRSFVDLLVKNAQIDSAEGSYTTDFAIRLRETTRSDLRNYDVTGVIEDAGDLSVLTGYQEIDAAGMKLVPGKVYPEIFDSMDALTPDKHNEWLKAGYTYLQIKKPAGGRFVKIPFHVVAPGFKPKATVSFGDTGTFIVEHNGVVRYTVVNGMVYDIATGSHQIRNGISGR